MQSQLSNLKPRIRNVVSTASVNQPVKIQKFVNFAWGIYDPTIYHGICGYVKTPDMSGKVTVFANGKIISLGGTSINQSIQQLNNAKVCLVQAGLIVDVKLEPKIQNIVATLTLGNPLNIIKIAKKIKGVIYEPEKFPALILKSANSVSYSIFASGKIVITGGKSEDELIEAVSQIQQKLSSVEHV